jgi:hypothetical protein
MGRKDQLYGKWKRILLNPDNPNEIYLVLEKDAPMEKKYIRDFENRFQGQDVILSITKLIRHKNQEAPWKSDKDQIIHLEEASKEEKKKKDEDEDHEESPFWGTP